MTTSRRKPATRVNALAVAHMLRGIQAACYTLYELADMCGLRYQTVLTYCNTLHKQKVIHICDWSEDVRGARTLRVYAMGAKDDAAKPARMTSKEICARYRAKKKQIQLLQRMSGNAQTEAARTYQVPRNKTLGQPNAKIQSTWRPKVAA